MIILDDNNKFIIEEKQVSIEYKNHLFFFSPVEEYEFIYSFFKQYIKPHSWVFVSDYLPTDVNIIVLYILMLLNCKTILDGKEYELSFAYAVPLNRDNYLKKFVLDNLRFCLKAKQIVFLPAETLYLFNTIPQKGLLRIIHDERRTIRRNVLTSIEEVDFSSDFFDFWKDYDRVRFNEIQSREFQEFFKYAYDTDFFHLFKYTVDDHLIAYNVCYYSENQKVIYDVLFPWKEYYKAYRIGIYSMIINLQRASKIGWGYSICYGKYKYKNDILDKLLEDN